MSFVAYRGTHKNLSGASVDWQVDIIDTRGDSGDYLSFVVNNPVENYTGLPQDLKPGVYPASFDFEMMISDEFLEQFIDDLFAEPEGTFHVVVYRDSVVSFIGTIIIDQSHYEDQYYPYKFTVHAEDGLYRLGTIDYLSKVGAIRRKTLVREAQTSNVEFSEDPVTEDDGGNTLEGTEWVMIEHRTDDWQLPFGNIFIHSSRRSTTYARYEQHSTESPGDGWVDQGNELWAKEIDFTDEEESEGAVPGPPIHAWYHLTRNIDDAQYIVLSDLIKEAMFYIPTKDLYSEGMYDVLFNWYEVRMPDFTSDPFQWIRVSEKAIAVGRKLDEALEELAKHTAMRIYFANGRFHFEQIPERADAEFSRHVYDKDGGFIETETINNDIDYTINNIREESGGGYKGLPALKAVTVSQKLNTNNLLDGVEWWRRLGANTGSNMGLRNLGRITVRVDDTRFLIKMQNLFKVAFNSGLWASLPPALKLHSTQTTHRVLIRCFVKNVDSGVIWYAKQIQANNDYDINCEWTSDPLDGTDMFREIATIPNDTSPIHAVSMPIKILTDELPADVGDSLDVFVTVIYGMWFTNPEASGFWTETHPNGWLATQNSTSDSQMITVDEEENPVSVDAVRVYEAKGNDKNTAKLEIEANFGDYGGVDEHIQVWADGYWARAKSWKRKGEGTSMEFLQLLASENLAIRLKHNRIYTGAYITSLLTPENRLKKGSMYFLPLTVERQTGTDTYSGEFVEIYRDDAVVPENPIATPEEFPTEGPGFIGSNDVPVDTEPLIQFVTDEEITASSTLTQVAIINTLEVNLAAGEVVTVLNLDTFQEEQVTLSQPILHDSTVMYFEEYTFTHTYPSGSPIYLYQTPAEPEGPGFGIERYRYSDDNYSGGTHTAPQYIFPHPDYNTAQVIDGRIDVYRGGKRMQYVPQAKAVGPMHWYINFSLKQFVFAIPLENESLVIDARGA